MAAIFLSRRRDCLNYDNMCVPDEDTDADILEEDGYDEWFDNHDGKSDSESETKNEPQSESGKKWEDTGNNTVFIYRHREQQKSAWIFLLELANHLLHTTNQEGLTRFVRKTEVWKGGDVMDPQA